jgi:hypothetical protein
MNLPDDGWKNKGGTSTRSPECCYCGTWKNHWLENTNKPWPKKCSIFNCDEPPTSGAHIFHPDVGYEVIVPACSSCNNPSNTNLFSLKSETISVYANQDKCENKKNSD